MPALKGGAILVYDMLIDDDRRPRTDGYCRAAAGFGYSGACVEALVAGQSMI